MNCWGSERHDSKDVLEWKREIRSNHRLYRSKGYEKFMEDKSNFLDYDLLDGNTHQMKVTRNGIVSSRDTILPNTNLSNTRPNSRNLIPKNPNKKQNTNEQNTNKQNTNKQNTNKQNTNEQNIDRNMKPLLNISPKEIHQRNESINKTQNSRKIVKLFDQSFDQLSKTI